MQLKKNEKYKGTWWPHNDPENKIRGELCYSIEKGIELHLDGDFNAASGGAIFRFNSLLGELDNKGTQVSLLDCFTSNTTSMGRIRNSVIVSNYLFVGQHFNSLGDVLIDNYSYSFTDFRKWYRGFDTIFDFGLRDDTSNLSMTYNAPSPTVITLDSGLEVHFCTRLSECPVSMQEEVLSIKELAYIKFVSKDKMPIADFMHLQAIFQRFFTLALGNYPNVTEIFFFSKKLDGGYISDIYIDVHYNCYRNSENSRKSYHFMPFTFKDIELSISDKITTWYNFFNKYEDIVNLYFTTVLTERGFAEIKFLSYAQFLEAYHRRKYSSEDSTNYNKYLLNKFFEKIRERLDDDDYNKIEESMRFSFEPTFAERLSELFDSCGGNLANEIINFAPHNQMRIKTKEKCIAECKDARNYYTHYDKRLSSKVYKGIELHYFADKIEAFIRYFLYIEIGFSHEEACNILGKIYRYNFT